MEFILHLPQDIDKNGSLWQLWDTFNEKFRYCQNTNISGTTGTDTSSLLLLAAHHQIKTVCSSLKIYNLDLPTLKNVLKVVEQACLPYFILLFERFRYFSLKRDPSMNVDDFVIILRHQAEICEFGNLKDSFVSNALCSSLKSESFVQDLTKSDEQIPEKLNFSDSAKKSLCNTNIQGAQKSLCNTDIQGGIVQRLSNSTIHLEMFGSSSDSICNSDSLNISSNTKSLSYTTSTHRSRNRENKHFFARDKRPVYMPTEKSRNDIKEKGTKLKSTDKVENLFLDGKLPPKVAVFGKDENSDLLKSFNTANTDNEAKSHFTFKRTKKANGTEFKQFHCCFCKKSFSGENCLRKHFGSKHSKDSEYVCKVCRTTFLNVEEYLVHCKNEHLFNRPNSGSVPSIKLRIKKSVYKYNCMFCRRVFSQESHLQKHIHCIHSKSFQCWSCGDYLQSLSEYKQHSEKHIVVGRFSCDLCHKQLPSIFRLMGHLKSHLMSQNKCEICGVIFIKQESLAKHVEKHKDEPVYNCKVCGKNFLIESRLHYHMKSHSGEKRFTCELCGKMYSQKINLVHHKRWHTGEQPFECEICGKRTRSSGDLSKHKRKHSDKYSYVCEICGRGFNYSSALVKHRIGHTGKRAYSCDVCGRTFIYREGLRDHIKANRCPGRRSELGYRRMPRTTKLLQVGMSSQPLNVEPKVFAPMETQRASATNLKDIPDWHCMLRNNETVGGTNAVLVPSFY